MTESRLTRKEEMQDTSSFCTGCGEMFLEGEEKKQIKHSINGWPDVWIHTEGYKMCFSDWFGE